MRQEKSEDQDEGRIWKVGKGRSAGHSASQGTEALDTAPPQGTEALTSAPRQGQGLDALITAPRPSEGGVPTPDSKDEKQAEQKKHEVSASADVAPTLQS